MGEAKRRKKAQKLIAQNTETGELVEVRRAGDPL
jgi:hypothetical protein